jgi:hypothetical protein
MSWSVSGELLHESLDFGAMKEAALVQNPECADQFDAVSYAVKDLINSAAIGAWGKRFNVAMSGHSNPNHEPRDGWANDAVTISISQK